MKKIKILVLALLVLLIPSAFAIAEGDEITLTQLLSIDAQTIDLQCQYEGAFQIINPFDSGQKVIRDISCLDLSALDNGNYLIERNQHTVSYKIRTFIKCVRESEGSLAERIASCYTRAKTDMREQHESEKDEIREHIEQLQSEADIDLNDFDWDIMN